MSSSTTPSFDPGFSTDAMTLVFGAENRVRTMLRVEAALAVACANHGLVSRTAADEIVAHCGSVTIDAELVLRDGWETGTPVLSLLDEVRRGLSAEAAAAIHFGATTQDIADTAMQLQMREGLRLILADVVAVVVRLIEVADEYRSTPMMARTFLQHGGPTTFGLRAAQWLASLEAHRWQQGFGWPDGTVQLGGPVGVLDGFGDVGVLVMRDLAIELRMETPAAPWHGDRGPLIRVAGLLLGLTRAAAKVATDVALLSSTEIAEVRVRGGGSSSIPGKHNPIDSVRTIAAAAACAGAVHTLAAAPPFELDRGVGGWHAEWFAVPVAFMTAAASVEALRRCVESLAVDEAAMRRNLGPADPTNAVRAAAVLIDRIIAAAKERIVDMSGGGATA